MPENNAPSHHQKLAEQAVLINEIVQAIRGTLVVSEVLQTTADRLHIALNASRCLIFRVDGNQEMAALQVSKGTGEGNSLINVYSDFYRHYRNCLSQGETVVLGRIDSSVGTEIQASARNCSIQAILIVPLLHSGTYVGGVSLHQCDNCREWSADEIAFVKSIADHCAIAIKQSELSEKLYGEREERYLAEQKIRIAEEKYRSIFENAIEGIFQSTKKGSFLSANPALARICGYDSPGTLIAKITDIGQQLYLNPNRREQFIAKIEKCGSVMGFESQIFRAGGQIIWISENARAVYDETGKLLYFEGTVEDITARKNAEATLEVQQKQLLKSERTNQAILNAIPDMIFRISREGIFLSFRPSRLIEPFVKPSEFIGKSVQEIMPIEVASETMQLIEKVLVTGELQTFEYQLTIGGVIEDFEARIVGCGVGEVLVMVRDITDRKQAQQSLAKSEAKFRSMIQNSSDIITLFNEEGIIEYESPSLEKILGYQPEELIGKNVFDFIHAEDISLILYKFEELIQQPGSVSLPTEYRFRHKNGAWYWLESTASNLIYDSFVGAVVVNSRDISERKKAEEQFKKSQQKYQAIFNNCFQFTGLLSPDGVMLEVNQTALDFVEAEAKDVIGLPFWKTPWWVSSDEPVSLPEIAAEKRLQKAIAQAAAGEFIRYEDEVWGAGGRVAMIDFSLKPVYDDNGNVVLLIFEGRNITELKQAQAERDRFFNNSADLMLTVSYDGEIKLVNSAWEKTLGYSKEELEGQNYRDFVHPEDLISYEYNCDIFEKNKQGIVEFQNRYRCKNGQYRWLSWNAVLFEEENLVYGFGRDVTERHQAEEALHKLNDELENRVKERTAQLLETVDKLEQEVAERRSIQEALKTSEERFRNLLETTNDFVWELDTNGVYTYASPSVKDILGYEAEEILGKTPFDFMSKNDAKRIRIIVNAIFVSQNSFHYLESINQHKEGHLVVLESNGVPVFNGEGLLCGYRGIARNISQRKQAEKALRESQLFIQRVADAVPGVIYIYDVEKRQMIYLNNQLNLLLGYDERDVKNMEQEFVSRFMHPEDFAKFEVYCRQFIICKDEDVLENEYRMKHANGEWRWFVSRDTIFSRSEDGSVQQILGTAQDITERKLSEETLKLRERAIEASSNSIVIVDMRLAENVISYVNPAFEKMTGYSPTEVLGKNCRFLQGKDRDQQQIAELRRCIKAGQACTVVLRNYRKDGTLFWNELSISPLFDGDNLTHFIGIQTDITHRKIAEEKLQEARDQLQAVLDAVPGFVGWISYDLRYLGVNRHLAASYNLNAEAFVGKELGFLQHSPGYTEFMSKFMADSPMFASQVIDSDRSGTGRCYLVAAQKYQQGKAAVSVGIDITDRKQAEEKLLASLREKEVLLKEIHHRVKNNLQIVSSLLKLQSGYIKDPAALALFKDSYNRVRSMALLHEKLYRSSDLARTDASDYIRNLVANLCSAYGVFSSQVQVKIDVEKIALDIDTAIPCGLIINELVSNALKYAFPNGKEGVVTVDLKLDDALCCDLAPNDAKVLYDSRVCVLRVADNGIGLPADFDVEKTDSLGLQLVFNLTEQLGGTMQLNGKGGTFYEIRFLKKR